MQNISRDNHFVPQMYLDAWKDEKGQIHEYKLLVEHENCDVWSARSKKSIAMQENFYICLSDNEESDEIEKWLNEKFETPAKNTFAKAINGEKLNSEDWKKMINYIACQIVRTPVFLQKFLNTSKNILSETFESTIKEVLDEMSNQLIDKNTKKIERKEYSKINNSFPLKITNIGQDDEDNELFKVETVIGKALYLEELKHYLTDTLEVLHKHRWQVLELDKDVKIPTSDDPVICLNYYGINNYDFGGGWGRKGCEIIFPISPSKIIYTHIGYKKKIEANYELSILIKKLIIEHAHRRIFSNFEDSEVVQQRKRYVDRQQCEKEKLVYEEFHKNYKEIEKDYLIRRHDI